MIVGIDVSKDKLDVHVSTTDKHFVIKNTPSSIKSFFKNKLALDSLELVVFEPTGGHELSLQCYLIDKKLPYHCVHPNRVHAFARGKGFSAKTDRIDANILALYGKQAEITADTHKTREQLELREYSARKSQLKEMIAGERHREGGPLICKVIKQSIKRNIKRLVSELEIISNKLDELIKEDEGLSVKYMLLNTVKGIGHEVSTQIITDIPQLGSLSREEISNLLGVAPMTRDSGKKSAYRPISKGKFFARRALYMAALVASRRNPRMTRFYQSLLERGKLKKVALVAVMRKMIIMINAMVRNNTPWCEEF